MAAKQALGQLGWDEIQAQKTAGDNWDGEGQPAGTSKSQALIFEAKFNKQTKASLPEKWIAKQTELQTKLNKPEYDADFFFFNKTRKPYESEKELASYIDDVQKSDILNPDQKLYLSTSATMLYRVASNPSTGQATVAAVQKLQAMEVKCIKEGIETVKLGESVYSFLSALGETDDPKVVEEKATEHFKMLDSAYLKATNSEISGRNVNKPFKVDLVAPAIDVKEKPPVKGASKAPDGNWYVEKDGKHYPVEL
jgi:hypothetical protein